MGERQAETRSHNNFGRGCLMVIFVPVIIYSLHFESRLISNLLHQAWWQLAGSPNYTIQVGESSFGFTAGTNLLIVRENEIVAVHHNRNNRLETIPNDRHYQWNSMSVDGLFARALGCAIFFPLLTCSIHYDLRLGYPRELIIKCPIPDACNTHFMVDSIHLDR